ncbi:hypothetical protein ACLFKQ_04330 [Myxosarcina sp. GI1(2024)]
MKNETDAANCSFSVIDDLKNIGRKFCCQTLGIQAIKIFYYYLYRIIAIESDYSRSSTSKHVWRDSLGYSQLQPSRTDQLTEGKRRARHLRFPQMFMPPVRLRVAFAEQVQRLACFRSNL